MSASVASIPSSTSERPDMAVDATMRGSGGQLGGIRKAARGANGHAVDAAKDGLAYLEIEHDAISEAMEAIVSKATAWCERQEGDAEEVDTLLSRMVALVAQHASLEERYVYPLFQSKLKGVVEGISADMIYERNVVDDNMNKEIMDLLLQMKMRKDGQLMLATLKKLQMIEDEHLTQEEHWFALLRRQLSTGELQQLADTMRSASATAPTLPHSLVGPSHALPSKLVHPVAGVLDRAMDKIAGRDTQLDKEADGPQHVHGVAHARNHV